MRGTGKKRGVRKKRRHKRGRECTRKETTGKVKVFKGEVWVSTTKSGKEVSPNLINRRKTKKVTGGKKKVK